MKRFDLHIGVLFPDLMSTYGDRGNIICLKKRGEWRDLSIKISELSECAPELFSKIDIILGGGLQNREQGIAFKKMQGKFKHLILKKLEADTPALFICGSMQLLGLSFQIAPDITQQGLGFFNCKTLFSKNCPRLTGNLVFKITAKKLKDIPPIFGFENHAGRTFIENGEPLGKVLHGFGNNGLDGLEGIFHKNAIGTYAHGPLLPKNPKLADWLLETAFEKKYGHKPVWEPINEDYSDKARALLSKKLSAFSLQKL